jgi:hypothetical protein
MIRAISALLFREVSAQSAGRGPLQQAWKRGYPPWTIGGRKLGGWLIRRSLVRSQLGEPKKSAAHNARPIFVSTCYQIYGSNGVSETAAFDVPRMMRS